MKGPAMDTPKFAAPEHPIHELIAKRWSPYSFADQSRTPTCSRSSKPLAGRRRPHVLREDAQQAGAADPLRVRDARGDARAGRREHRQDEGEPAPRRPDRRREPDPHHQQRQRAAAQGQHPAHPRRVAARIFPRDRHRRGAVSVPAAGPAAADGGDAAAASAGAARRRRGTPSSRRSRTTTRWCAAWWSTTSASWRKR